MAWPGKRKALAQLEKAGVPVPRSMSIKRGGKAVTTSYSDDDRFVVRPAYGNDEDEDRTYAGQFPVFMNVSRRELNRKIVEVFEAYDAYDGSGYERRASREAGRGQYVLVQEMVEPVLSGVAFSENPLGVKNERVLMIGDGAFAAGGEEPATMLAFNVDDGSRRVIADAGVDIPDGLPGTVLGYLGTAEGLFGCPQDMEFAVDADGEAWVLQCRPITTFGNPYEFVCDSGPIAAMPGFGSSVLASSVSRSAAALGMTGLLRSSGLPASDVSALEPYAGAMLRRVSGRAFCDVAAVCDCISALPFGGVLARRWLAASGASFDPGSHDGPKLAAAPRLGTVPGLVMMLAGAPDGLVAACDELGAVAACAPSGDALADFRTLEDALSKWMGASLGNDLLLLAGGDGRGRLFERARVARTTALDSADDAAAALRERALAVGRGLAESGALDEPEHVFFLESGELDGTCMAFSVRSRMAAEQTFPEELPKRIVFAEEPFDLQSHGMAGKRWHAADGALSIGGIGVSYGRACATALVVGREDAMPSREDAAGKVIVSDRVRPEWSSAISGAAAVVSGAGNMLSDAAIVSREMLKPAVFSVGDVSGIIGNGDLVEVDATAGTVTVVRKG